LDGLQQKSILWCLNVDEAEANQKPTHENEIIISAKIEFVPSSEFEKFVPEAEKISPDPNDTEYFALALKLKCCIWSNDKKLKNQNTVKVYSAEDLIRILQ